MGALQSISEAFVAVVQHLPLIVFIIALTWFCLMGIRGRWYKVVFLIFFTPKCQAYSFCSNNEFNLCTTINSTIETNYHVVNPQNTTILLKFINDGFYFNVVTQSNCTSSSDFYLVKMQAVLLNSTDLPGCLGGWISNTYFDSVRCKNMSDNTNLRLLPGGFTITTREKPVDVERFPLYNLTFKWKHDDFTKNLVENVGNLSKVACTTQKLIESCRNKTSSSGTIRQTCDTSPLPVLTKLRRKRSSEFAVSSTTSVFSLISLDTGYADSSALWENIIRTQKYLNELEKIVANLTDNQMLLNNQVVLDQLTIKEMLDDLKQKGLRLDKAEKAFNNTHLCVMRNESNDLTHYLRIKHMHDNGEYYHDCKNLILVNDSLSGLIDLTKQAHYEAIQSLRMSLIRDYLLTLRWEYPCSLILIILGVILILVQKRAFQHRHYKKGDEWMCPFPHYPNSKGLCSCGKNYEFVKLMDCSIEKY
ncbi:glycoprotein precursor [Old schoolhouse virus 2]|uniref:Glycoprotein n=2 Tax=Hartmanivirus scholae TaxID=3052217 RepID=A0A3Q8Q2I2_9VIRU|nr:glycoprotein precursor [Old schoolhouse virus 1]AZI72575.1 glycoprotein precursor [Old schoolhouse virus 1]AZI72581.1 glycoprotein precursor [Old schoolhouse virus 2]